MRLFWSFAVILHFAASSLKAQNLVPNPSFEDTTKCPNGQDQIWNTKYWYGLMFKFDLSTPDYFHSCCQKPYIPPNFTPAVPANSWGYQYPASGYSYAGGVIQSKGEGPNAREYLGVKLIKPLQSGRYYLVNFKTNLANSNFNVSFASNNIGARFLFGDTMNVIPNKSHINYSGIIVDTLNWTTVKGIFKSDTNYTHLAIGNFYTDALSKWQKIYTESPYVSYYYYDDVKVYEFPKISNRDTSICLGDSVFLDAFYEDHFIWFYKSQDSMKSIPGRSFWVKPKRTTTYYTIDRWANIENVDSITITVYPPPKVKLGKDTLICEGEQITLDAYNIGAKYAWNVGSTSPKMIVNKEGKYSVKAYVGDCYDSDTIEVKIKPVDNCRNFINVYPNPFLEKIHVSGNFIEPLQLEISLADALGRDLGIIHNDILINEFDQIFNLHWLMPGIYFLKVKWGETNKVYKLIRI